MMHTALVFLVFLVPFVLGFNPFMSSCPPGCASVRCPISIGCGRCQAGYCLSFGRMGRTMYGVCLRTCKKGQYCMMGFCTNCHVTNCERCTSRSNCIKCEYNYYLYKPSSWSSDRCVSRFECEYRLKEKANRATGVCGNNRG
ncbi:hypothetical protein KUTeg_013297 [Tegillarca granosa]|uniref:R-spondin Fu-CRD domain-containing protein n=1 Tax=Tegillarca granosa TaxID=220873 RepID=A0ABQ9ETA1_TEGGR|nr:hypothetical protein KUTeg_013297 [Tegillarca granosa]